MKVEKGKAMNRLVRSVLLGTLMVGALSCEARTDRTDTGGVVLTISSVQGLPTGFSMNVDHDGDGVTPDSAVTIQNLTLRNIVISSGTGGDLQDVEVRSYQVTYRRLDNTNGPVPPTYVNGAIGILVPHNGTASLINVPLLGADQLNSRPLRDLVFRNGGQEQGTGLKTIKIAMTITFFGRTLGGADVSTNPQDWVIEFTP
jgi:hypothetical protein